MDTETQLIEANRTTTLPDGSNIIYPSTNALGDFQGTPQDANTNPSYIPSSWLNLINRFMGRLLLAKGVTPSSAITAAQLSSAVSPYWQEDGDYLAGDIKIKDGTRHISTRPHRSSPANAPGVEGGPWVELELWQRDRMMPLGYIYLNKSNPTNPAALANPWPGTWATLSANDYLAIQGGRYALDTQYDDGLPNIVGSFFGLREGLTATGAFSAENGSAAYGAGTFRMDKGLFDASKGTSTIYGNANHVQPQTQSVVGFVKTGMAY